MAEARANVTVVIERPVEEVFAFLSNYRNNAQWQTGIRSVEPEEPIGVGKRIRITRTVLGRETSSVVKVVTFELNKRLRTKTEPGAQADFEGGYSFESAGEGRTRVVFEGLITIGGMLGRLGGASLAASTFQSQMDGDLKKLKALLEAR